MRGVLRPGVFRLPEPCPMTLPISTLHVNLPGVSLLRTWHLGSCINSEATLHRQQLDETYVL